MSKSFFQLLQQYYIDIAPKMHWKFSDIAVSLSKNSRELIFLYIV